MDTPDEMAVNIRLYGTQCRLEGMLVALKIMVDVEAEGGSFHNAAKLFAEQVDQVRREANRIPAP